MKFIGLMSDTHGFLEEDMLGYFADCDEIWHAGDIGENGVADRLARFKPLRAVYGNIDGTETRMRFPEDLHFFCEGLKVFMTHIGGNPGRYYPRVRQLLKADPPDLFICGHSHILKIVPDQQFALLHINPGACGQEGFHLMRTMVRFRVDHGRLEGLEVIELGRRGKLI